MNIKLVYQTHKIRQIYGIILQKELGINNDARKQRELTTVIRNIAALVEDFILHFALIQTTILTNFLIN